MLHRADETISKCCLVVLIISGRVQIAFIGQPRDSLTDDWAGDLSLQLRLNVGDSHAHLTLTTLLEHRENLNTLGTRKRYKCVQAGSESGRPILPGYTAGWVHFQGLGYSPY